jgi:long-subunit fatty acid transport protein
MMSKRIALKFFSLIFLLLTFFLSPSSWALVQGPETSVFNFRFNNPGARSNAMGGAFIGLADDATAAFTNPAGLTILTKPEISAEYKYTEATTFFVDGDGAHESDETFSDISFLSYIHPMEKTSVAVFRHQFVNQGGDFVWQHVIPGGSYYLINTEMEAVTYGISVGHEITDTFSFGISVGFDQLDWDIQSKTYDPSFPSYPNAETIHSVDDTAYAEHFTASMLWNPFGELNLGLVYRMGPKFETKYVTYRWDNNQNYWFNGALKQILKIPDVWGIGMSYRFFTNFTTALDINYVEYSDLLDDYIDAVGNDITDEWYMDDEIEIHVGLEYIFDINEIPFAVRAGYYYLPQKLFQYNGTVQFTREFIENYPDTDDHIFSLGFGAVFNNFQIDIAGSAGDYIKEFTSSIVFRFD